MVNFLYNIPTKVYFGEGQIKKLGKELKLLGKKVLICYGGGSIKKNGLLDRAEKEIENAGLAYIEFSGIEPNPKIQSVRDGANVCKDEGIDVVLAIGGGSVIDCAKWIAACALTDAEPWNVVLGKDKVKGALPIVTILTMAATGSEMDIFGVISNPETNEKYGGGSRFILPKISFLDPTYTYSVSKYQTACGCADILSHLFEEYFNLNDGLFMIDEFSLGMMKTIIKYAPIALREPDNYDARANIMWTATWAINGFITQGRSVEWSCHPIEHELSAFYDITHGLGLAILTPPWLKYCLDETTVDKYVKYGVSVFGIDSTIDKFEIANKAIELTESFLFNTLGLDNKLSKIGIDSSKFDVMAEKACGPEGVIRGFKDLNKQDVLNILNMCK